MHRAVLVMLAFCAAALTGLSLQAGIIVDGTFQNLGFDSALMVPLTGTAVPWDASPPLSSASALPNWTVMEDSTVCNAIWGGGGLDETSVSLIQAQTGTFAPVEGLYAVFLSGNSNAPTPYFKSASISQTGKVASTAKSIQFWVSNTELPIVTLNGVQIPLVTQAVSGNMEEVAGNVSQFAGQTADLAFTTPAGDNFFVLDDISFSTDPVPEPSSAAIAAIGGLWVLRRRRTTNRVAVSS